jgi:TonB family protein
VTLWLSNLVAYCVQLAALVGTAIALVSLLRLTRPRATLRFWQGVFAISLIWPVGQLLATASPFAFASPVLLERVFASGALWNGTPGNAADLYGFMALDTRTVASVAAVLVIVAIVRVAYLAMGLLRLRAICAASEPAQALAAVIDPLQRELRATADVRFSDHVDSPATLGVRRPIVLLPRSVRELTLPLQRAVVCHELLHVQRRDWLPAVLEEFWCAVFWFHPAARALTSRLGLAREALVDEATIRHTGDRRAYAAALLEFSGARVRLSGATTLIGRRHLERRIAFITQEVQMPAFSLAARLAVATVVVAVATIAATSATPISATLPGQAGKVYKPQTDKGVTLPSVVKEVKPAYTAAAMQARIQGSVFMSVVVLDTGDVGDVTVTTSLDREHGLDDNAVEAARQWRFKPGTKDGKPVAVEVAIQMTFTLKK